ncbi:hypothetical protein [Advenella incenata]|jgi:hypothetical protein|uniref:hypothetical protein n=1 Tax=Advenella incenata TaxID=267800 RepID=UPI0013EEACF8|nr:hypothetical protein [Advenella incenata]
MRVVILEAAGATPDDRAEFAAKARIQPSSGHRGQHADATGTGTGTQRRRHLSGA